MDYFRSTSTGLGETVEYHGLLQEYHTIVEYRTWRDCGIPWITSGIPETVEYQDLQDLERDCGIPWITSDLGNTMDYFRNTTTGLGETVEYHGLLQEYH